MTSQPLFSCRTGIKMAEGTEVVAGFMVHEREFKASWPLGKVRLHARHLTVGTLVKSFDIPYGSVDSIRKQFFFRIVINHHCPDAPSIIYLDGPLLWRKLTSAVRKHNLPLKLG